MPYTRLWNSILLLSLLVLPTSDLREHFSSSQQAIPKEQSLGSISIVSPPDGTIVRPGETLHIDVSVPLSKTVRMMMILSPLGQSEEVRESPPWSFTLTIPKDGGVSGGGPLLGKHPVTASAATVGQDLGNDTSIMVDVERPDLPVTLWTQESGIFLNAIGEEYRVIVSGVFPDGSDLKLNESCCLSFGSSDAKVATVTDDGVVTVIGPGNAFITATYRQGDHNVQRSIPLNISPLALNVSPSVLDFGENVVGSTSTPQELTLTNLSTSPMDIVKPEIQGEFSETDDCVSVSPLAGEGGACTIRVTFTPTRKGLRSGKMNIASQSSQGVTTVHLSGIGK
jgi:centrosomal CEP192-like protein